MAKNNDLLSDIVWGNKLFVNAQFVLHLVKNLSLYSEDKIDLESIFIYANALWKQNKIKLYDELKREVEEILFLESELKNGSVSIENKDLINFVLSSTITIFTSKITRRG